MDELKALASQLDGQLHTDTTTRILYATDASAYREMPLAVAIPVSDKDLQVLIRFANDKNTALIPRTAGTSLAGQVVGNGIVVDLSKYFTSILEFNATEKWVRVQPGVIRDELNLFLKPHGLMFGPETSTANRAMIGGMVGNNSCGSNSVVYRSTREHVLELKAILSDGSTAVFRELSPDAFHEKCDSNTFEGSVYRQIRTMLGNYNHQQQIRKEFPKPSVERRNTGYAIDVLLESAPFVAGLPDFNFCKLLSGSEGTLALITEIKLNLVELPPKENGLLCVHFNTIDEALRANLVALKYRPAASELIDHYILECTKENKEQVKNRFFVQGDPGAILVIEFTRATRDEIIEVSALVEQEMRAAGLGYHFPLLFGNDTRRIWTLRKAGLGLLSNLPGDAKAVPVIEDTAVDVLDLPAYIRDFNAILQKHNLYSVHYAHAGSGELHLRPIINLKTTEGNRLFRIIAEEIALLVKKYNGSLSGEHGDGRLRGEFIRTMIGDANYELLVQIKRQWDPKNIFNPGKIVHTPPMDSMLRYSPGQQTPSFKTVFRFYNQDVLQHAEQCNGSGDCRKTQLAGGTMCPSFMATRNEKDSTRARANILREFLTHSPKENRFDHDEILDVMDLCLSCKACKSECPSNVDMAKLKAEFLQQYYDVNGIPFRSKLIAGFSKSARMGAIAPAFYNFMVTAPVVSNTIKSIAGFAQRRSLPHLYHTTLRKWYRKQRGKDQSAGVNKRVYLFCDEFTDFNDTEIGIKTILLLEKLGYDVIIPEHLESGRASLSKGLLRKAKEIANKNIELLHPLISSDAPLLGIEPSALLTFRDEYIDLATEENLEVAKLLASRVFLVDEFLASEIGSGRIDQGLFSTASKQIALHGHCQQKALSDLNATVKILSFPKNYEVTVMPTGCCGMAGSFGYEKEHYDLSMQIGNLVLFPTIQSQLPATLIAAPGTSCRHQIKDGTGKRALHPMEILFDALLQ